MKLYLDDVRSPPDDTWTVCRTVAEAQALLATGNVEWASLDHDLDVCPVCHGNVDAGATTVHLVNGVRVPVLAPAGGQADVLLPCRHAITGYDLVKWMIETGHWPKHKPLVHSANPVGRAAMQMAIERYFDDAVRAPERGEEG